MMLFIEPIGGFEQFEPQRLSVVGLSLRGGEPFPKLRLPGFEIVPERAMVGQWSQGWGTVFHGHNVATGRRLNGNRRARAKKKTSTIEGRVCSSRGLLRFLI